jgi:serine/threonine protein kinase
VKHISVDLDRHRFVREVETLVKLNHPCVLRILKWALPQATRGGEIHMELAEHGSLEAVLEQVNSYRAPVFWNSTGIGIIICGIVLGMRYVHSRGIIHRDLKPSNILFNSKDRPLIADFGASWIVKDDATQSGGVGTIHYAAPEMYQDDVIVTTKCDVFSFGLVLYEILTGKPVFHPSQLPFGVIRRLRAGDFPELPSDLGTTMQNLLRKCWANDPEMRPSFAEIFAVFKSDDFAILPDANAGKIDEFCTAVVRWEEQAGIRF